MLQDEKILITGATGQVAGPIARALAGQNDVTAIGRFGDDSARESLTGAGVRCERVDLLEPDFGQLATDFTLLLNFAVVKTSDFPTAFAGNIAGLGFLMEHCQRARAMLHCSSTAVYERNGHRAFTETDDLGDNHRIVPSLETYSLSKIGAEAMCHYAARRWNLPAVIMRMNVPYGGNGGWPSYHLDDILAGNPIPVSVDAPSSYNPIHQDDVLAQLEALLDVAGVPPTTLNWGGNDVVSIEEWCAYMGELVGVEPIIEPTAQTFESVTVDVTNLQRVAGRATVGWRDGFRRMIAERHPEALKPAD
jgi:nucleoside-diphosphate-sugar epimerase